LEPDPGKRKFVPVTVKASVAQAAMIGDPVSMPRVIHLVELYNSRSGKQNTFFIEVPEQAIMDWTLLANRNGHIACTHGGESLAGLVAAQHRGIIDKNDVAIIDSTAHSLKFSDFIRMYFEKKFPPEFEISPDPDFINSPLLIKPKDLKKVPAQGQPLTGNDFKRFVKRVSEEIARELGLKKAPKA
jgi:threonine synthase